MKQLFEHPENVLLAAITDERPHKAILTQIMKEISHVSAPLDATEYHDMIDWQTLAVTEPPCFDLFDGHQIEEHDPGSNLTKYPLLSLPPSHTGGGKIREAGYRSFSRRCVGRDASP